MQSGGLAIAKYWRYRIIVAHTLVLNLRARFRLFCRCARRVDADALLRETDRAAQQGSTAGPRISSLEPGNAFAISSGHRHADRVLASAAAVLPSCLVLACRSCLRSCCPGSFPGTLSFQHFDGAAIFPSNRPWMTKLSVVKNIIALATFCRCSRSACRATDRSPRPCVDRPLISDIT